MYGTYTPATSHIIKTFPTSSHLLQINQPNWIPTTPMQELYLQHVKSSKEVFDMTNYNNHNYWMRVAPRRPFFNASFTKFNDGVLPQGPKLLMFAIFALPVTLVVDLLPFLKGWFKRAHNAFHGGMYMRVVDVPKFAFNNTVTVNRMGIIWVVARFACRVLQMTREQAYLVSSFACLWLTLPPFYRKARVGIPFAYCLASYCTYKYLERNGYINVLGIRRGRRSRELFSQKTTRFRMRSSEERLIKFNTSGFLGHFFHWHSRLDSRFFRKRDDYFEKKSMRPGWKKNLWQTNMYGNRMTWNRRNGAAHDKTNASFWSNRRHRLKGDYKQNPYPDWYYGRLGNQSQVDWDRERGTTRDRAWAAVEHMRNTQGIKFVQPKAYDLNQKELQSVELLNNYLDERYWANPNIVRHGKEHHRFEHFLEFGDNYFF